MMTGRIFVKDIVLRCNIGITDEERRKKQDVLVNILLFVDLSKAIITDDLKDTIDYTEPYNKIRLLVENKTFNLIERLANSIADICLEDKKVQKVKVRLEKLHILKDSKSAGVELEKGRNGRSRL